MALHYNAKTETWKCTQCGKQYDADEARGEAAHAAVHTRENRRRTLLKDKHAIGRIPIKSQTKQELEPYYNMEQEEEGSWKTHTAPARTRADASNTEENSQTPRTNREQDATEVDEQQKGHARTDHEEKAGKQEHRKHQPTQEASPKRRHIQRQGEANEGDEENARGERKQELQQKKRKQE